MIKNIAAILCIISMLFTSTAFAYERDVEQASGIQEEEPETQDKAPDEKEGEDDYDYSGGGMSGMEIGGYVLVALGGVAAIAGSTIWATTDKRILGASLSAGGAALGLAGSMMLIFGHRSYAVGPAIDPKTGTYGVMLSKRF